MSIKYVVESVKKLQELAQKNLALPHDAMLAELPANVFCPVKFGYAIGLLRYNVKLQPSDFKTAITCALLCPEHPLIDHYLEIIDKHETPPETAYRLDDFTFVGLINSPWILKVKKYVPPTRLVHAGFDCLAAFKNSTVTNNIEELVKYAKENDPDYPQITTTYGNFSFSHLGGGSLKHYGPTVISELINWCLLAEYPFDATKTEYTNIARSKSLTYEQKRQVILHAVQHPGWRSKGVLNETLIKTIVDCMGRKDEAEKLAIALEIREAIRKGKEKN